MSAIENTDLNVGVLLNGEARSTVASSCGENKYSSQIDGIPSAMQDDGYKIVDVKFNSIQGQGLAGSMGDFHALSLYR